MSGCYYNLLERIRMNVDYVIPMVFDDDPVWRIDCLSFIGMKKNHVRYRSWGTERLLVRCIKTFMPWVDNIIILLARESQKREWMEEEGVRVVYHSDFIPQKYLPCFNSCIIEMFLPYIPGLSEYFIYGNDDMFPLSPLDFTDFFMYGLPCQHHKIKPFPVRKGTFHKKCRNQQIMVGSRFGWKDYDYWLINGHSINAFLKSECLKAREVFDDEIRKGMTAMRSVTSYNQYLYMLWLYFTKKYIDHVPNRSYISAGQPIETIRETIMAPDAGVVCINDTECVEDFSVPAAVVREAISEKLLFIHSNSGRLDTE